MTGQLQRIEIDERLKDCDMRCVEREVERLLSAWPVAQKLELIDRAVEFPLSGSARFTLFLGEGGDHQFRPLWCNPTHLYEDCDHNVQKRESARDTVVLRSVMV